MNSVLVVTSTFPPTADPGVFRVTKFVKYLPGRGPGWDLVERSGLGRNCDPLDAEAMAEGLRAALRRWQKGDEPPPVPRERLERFERSNLTGELSAILTEVAGRP